MKRISKIGLGLALASLCACASGNQETRSESGTHSGEVEPGHGGHMTVTAEQNDAIDALFRRKAPQLQRCWQEEYERTQNRKLEGEITLQMIVSKKGQATGTKVTKSTINAPTVESCVVNEVASWQFPEGPGDAPYRRTVHLGAAF
jgi:hypothetical protein